MKDGGEILNTDMWVPAVLPKEGIGPPRKIDFSLQVVGRIAAPANK
jgi:hypothetical protein